MADEADFVIETTDAGASATIPMEAGQIKKGGYVFLRHQCNALSYGEPSTVATARMPMNRNAPSNHLAS